MSPLSENERDDTHVPLSRPPPYKLTAPAEFAEA